MSIKNPTAQIKIKQEDIAMPAYKQKLHAFEKSIKIIEELAQNDSFAIAEKSLQALNKTYETLTVIFAAPEEAVMGVA